MRNERDEAGPYFTSRLGSLINESTPDAPASADEVSRRLQGLARGGGEGVERSPLSAVSEPGCDEQNEYRTFVQGRQFVASRGISDRMPVIHAEEIENEASMLREIEEGRNIVANRLLELARTEVRLQSEGTGIALTCDGSGQILELKIESRDCSAAEIRKLELDLVRMLNHEREQSRDMQAKALELEEF